MRFRFLPLIALSIGLLCGVFAASAHAQQPRLEQGASYDCTHANAPAGQCVCFSLNGGSASAALSLPHAFSAVAELGGNHASNIDGTSQSITTYTYLAGGRYGVRTGSHSSVFGAVLLGATHEASNYAYVASANAFTLATGGGLHLTVGRHLGINLLQLDWLHSDLPNGSNNRQNDLSVGTGLYLRLGGR